MEERQKIRAQVVCKEFIERLGDKARQHEPPEIDWRGRLYVGPVQLLENAERDEPQPEDQFVSDIKGNHTQWFVSAAKVEVATGLASNLLQHTWAELTSA